MLQIHGLHKAYGAATILSQISFVINAGDHVGLIGPNGSGKSSLLRCLVGNEQPDGGQITLAAGTSIGYLSQTFEASMGATVGESLAAAQADLLAAEVALQQASDALATATDMDAALAAYAEALSRFEALGGYELRVRAAAVLHGMGLGSIDVATPVAHLSGGQKTRLGLARLLLQEPTLLLLDEPTNHLDTEALEWLERFVQSYPYAALIVSHDRAFLDRTVTRILALDPETHTVTSYAGNYSAYAAARQGERERQATAWKQQQEYVAQVQADIQRLKGQAQGLQHIRTSGNRDDKFVRGQRDGAQSTSRMARSRERKLERYLQSDERVEKPRPSWGLKLDFGPPPPGGRAVLALEDVAFSYAATPGPALLQGVSFEVQHGERVALLGPNGTGKSTLLHLIAGQLQPDAGRVQLGANIRVGMLSQEHQYLDPQAPVLAHALRTRAMSETEARSFLHFFLFGGDSVFQPVAACSPGERSRLQLALLVLQGCNLLLLDEPLNHLDIEGREHFEQALDAFEGTVLVVSHDRHFVRTYAWRWLELRDGQLTERYMMDG